MATVSLVSGTGCSVPGRFQRNKARITRVFDPEIWCEDEQGRMIATG
jgi:hypothetical protein